MTRPHLPRWAWIVLLVLVALILLPLYLRWFVWVTGSCVSAGLLHFFAPVVAWSL